MAVQEAAVMVDPDQAHFQDPDLDQVIHIIHDQVMVTVTVIHDSQVTVTDLDSGVEEGGEDSVLDGTGGINIVGSRGTDTELHGLADTAFISQFS